MGAFVDVTSMYGCGLALPNFGVCVCAWDRVICMHTCMLGGLVLVCRQL